MAMAIIRILSIVIPHLRRIASAGKETFEALEAIEKVLSATRDAYKDKTINDAEGKAILEEIRKAAIEVSEAKAAIKKAFRIAP